MLARLGSRLAVDSEILKEGRDRLLGFGDALLCDCRGWRDNVGYQGLRRRRASLTAVITNSV